MKPVGIQGRRGVEACAEPGGQRIAQPSAAQPAPLRDEGPLAPLRSRQSREPSGRETTEATRDRASHTIISGMRSHIARKPYAEMLDKGSIWKTASQVFRNAGLLGPQESLAVESLSSINLTRLRRQLGTLTESEVRLFDRFTQQVFFATHFSDAELDHASSAGSTMSVFSRQKLHHRAIGFNRENTTGVDILMKGDDGFVFFALECGEEPSKFGSRFGKTLYRVPYDSPVFQQVAWGALDDLLNTDLDTPDVDRYQPGLDDVERSAIKHEAGHARRKFQEQPEAFDDIFAGKDLLAGAALSIIAKLRAVNKQLQAPPMTGQPEGQVHPLVEKLLSSHSPRDINSLLATFHRPEVRVPVHFFSSDFRKITEDELQLMKWNSAIDNWHNLTETEKIMMSWTGESPPGGKPVPTD